MFAGCPSRARDGSGPGQACRVVLLAEGRQCLDDRHHDWSGDTFVVASSKAGQLSLQGLGLLGPTKNTDISQPQAEGQFRCCLKLFMTQTSGAGEASRAEQGEAGDLHVASPRATLAPFTCPQAPSSEVTGQGRDAWILGSNGRQYPGKRRTST